MSEQKNKLREKITPENMNELTHIAMDNPPEDSYNQFTYNCYLERTKKVVGRTIALIEPLMEEAKKQSYDQACYEFTQKAEQRLKEIQHKPKREPMNISNLIRGKQKDRPDREKEIEGLIDKYMKWLRGDEELFTMRMLLDQIIALFPDIEYLIKQIKLADRNYLDLKNCLDDRVEEAKREERERIKSLALQAIADEPEFPSDMPDELWKEIDGDREITQRVMQNTVRITKRAITDRFVQALKEEK